MRDRTKRKRMKTIAIEPKTKVRRKHKTYPEIKTGSTFGRLTVIDKSDKVSTSKYVRKDGTIKESKYYTHFNCQCSCGNTTVVTKANLNKGHTKSCGCLQKENRKQYGEKYKKRKKGNLTHSFWLMHDADDRIDDFENIKKYYY